MRKRISKNVRTVLEILKDEINGDVASAMRKLTPDYTMTWVYKGRNSVLFPRTRRDVERELEVVYPIRGRKYDIKNIAEGRDLVMVEMVESYPDARTGKIYRTPLVIVLEMKKGKIRKGRHYCDPDLSYLHLTKKQVEKAFE